MRKGDEYWNFVVNSQAITNHDMLNLGEETKIKNNLKTLIVNPKEAKQW